MTATPQESGFRKFKRRTKSFSPLRHADGRPRLGRVASAVMILGTTLWAVACGGATSGATRQVTDSSGDQLAITVLAIDPNTRPHDQWEEIAPHTADRTLAVEITIKNLLPHNGYYGTPIDDLAVVGSNGRIYPAVSGVGTTESPEIIGEVMLNSGQSATGWIPVDMPHNVQPRDIRFQDALGGPTSEWQLAGVPTTSASAH